MNYVVCLCIGDKYDDQYVIKLQRMVSKHTTRPYTFVCFSDRVIPGVDTIVIDNPLQYGPVWYKLWILQHSELPTTSKKIFFDLDVVIQGNIDWVFDVDTSCLTVISADWKPEEIKCIPGNTGYNSSIMVWVDAVEVWRKFEESPEYYMKKYKGMDRFLWNEPLDISTLPENQVYSYREGASLIDQTPMKYRPDYSVCIFNQHPKPHTALSNEPARSFWI